MVRQASWLCMVLASVSLGAPPVKKKGPPPPPAPVTEPTPKMREALGPTVLGGLANAKRLLNDCPGLRSDVAEHACGICCRSVSCTLEEHNSMLDAIATAKWLEGFGKRLG